MVLDIAMDMFRPRADLARQVQVLARLAEEALVYELIYDDLDEASSAVRHLLENAVAAAR